MKKRIALFLAMPLLLLASCAPTPREEAATFLKEFDPQYQKLIYETSKAQWLANTDIKPANDSLSEAAERVYSKFVGSKEVIQKVRSRDAERSWCTVLFTCRCRLRAPQRRQAQEHIAGSAHFHPVPFSGAQGVCGRIARRTILEP